MTMLADVDVEDRINAERVASLADLVPDSDAWRAARYGGVGGSEAAAVAGVGEFDSAFEVYLRKTGTHPDGRDWEGNRAAKWGKKLEDIVAEDFVEETGMTLVKPRYLYRSIANPWMLANPDRFAIDPVTGEIGIYEGKTCSHWMADRWGTASDEPATYALLQAVHYMIVCDLPWAVIAVLIAGQDDRRYRIERDSELCAMLIELTADFWDRVQRKDPPLATYRTSDTDVLSRMWDGSDKTPLLVGDDFVDLVRRYNTAKTAGAAAEKEKKETGNQMRQILGDHVEAVDLSGRTVCTWKPASTTKLNQGRFQATSPHLFATYCDTTQVRTLLPKEVN